MKCRKHVKTVTGHSGLRASVISETWWLHQDGELVEVSRRTGRKLTLLGYHVSRVRLFAQETPYS